MSKVPTTKTAFLFMIVASSSTYPRQKKVNISRPPPRDGRTPPHNSSTTPCGGTAEHLLARSDSNRQQSRDDPRTLLLLYMGVLHPAQSEPGSLSLLQEA